MKTKFRLRMINVLLALVFVLGPVLNGTAPVAAQMGAVVAAANPSETTPSIGEQITVTINIDMTAVSTPDDALGGFTATLSWNPAVLSYVSNSGILAGFIGAINPMTGTITFNGANTSGVTGSIDIFTVTFDVVGGGNAGLVLGFSAMAAAGTFNNLMPIISITQTNVTVAGETPSAVVTLDGPASVVTADDVQTVNVANHTTGTGVNRLMIVGISWNSDSADRPISTVTFTASGGSEIPLTQEIHRDHGTTSPYRYAAIYSLLVDTPEYNISSGQEGQVSVTFSGGIVTAGIIVGVANFSGVDQTDPIGVTNGAFSPSNNTTPTVTLTGLSGDELVFDTLFLGGNPPATVTLGHDQGEVWGVTDPPAHTIANARGAASTEQATGDSVTMSWTAGSSSLWTIAAVAINPAAGAPVACYALTLTSGSFGTPAIPDLANSPSCPEGQYVEGQVIGLTANPEWGYEVQTWSGTDNNSSTELTNVVTMPPEAHTVHVTYQSKACYDLTLSSGDHGGDPIADPISSLACTLGDYWYVAGEVIELTAYPDSGYKVASWSGTDDDSSKALTNQVTMPGATHAVSVAYEEETPEVTLDGSVVYGTTFNGNNVNLDVSTGLGQNRLMLVGVSYNSSTTSSAYITTVTFTPNGGSEITLDLVRQQWAPPSDTTDPGRMAAIYVLDPADNPSAGTEGTLTVTFSASFTTGAVVGVQNFKGVDQTDPLGEPNSAATENTMATVSVPVTTMGNELVFDTVWGGGQSAPTITVNETQNQLWNDNSTSNTAGGASIKQASVGTTLMNWTRGNDGYMAIVAVPINPAIGETPSHTVTFDANGGSGTMTVQTANVPTELTLNSFSRSGYSFSGWNTIADGTGTAYVDGAIYEFAADITLYAQWSADVYTLTINIIGSGSVSKVPDTMTYVYGTEVVLTATPAQNYTFSAWSGALTGSDNPTTLTMDENKTVSATFITGGGPPSVSSFYGDILFVDDDTGPEEGEFIDVYIDAVTDPATAAEVIPFEEGLVYAVNIPGYPGGSLPDTVTFKYGERTLAVADWILYANTGLNLHPPKADAGGPYVTLLTDESFALAGIVTDMGDDIASTVWDLDNDGAFDDATDNLEPEFASTAVGAFPISLMALDQQDGEGYGGSLVFVITVGGLTGQTYDGSPKSVTVSPLTGYTIVVLYNDSPTPPTNAGNYPVIVQIKQGDDLLAEYSAGDLVVAKANATVILGDLGYIYDGNQKEASATTVPTGLTVIFTYDGETDPPTDVGNYEVVATVVDDNYQGTAEGMLVISDPSSTHEIDLVAGWNLVSFPIIPVRTEIEDVLASIDGQYTLVYAWDASGGHSGSGNWMRYTPGGYSQTLTTLDHTQGFWIFMTEAATLEISGVYPDEADIGLLNDVGGWNLVGYPSNLKLAPDVVLDEIEFDLIVTFIAADTVDSWKLFDPYSAGYANDLVEMQSGYGFWIYVTADATLTVPFD